jgi:ribonuclease Z
MRLLFLGTTGYHPNERRQTTCLMIPEAGILLDAGTGLFRIRPHLATSWLDIFLSHAHLDHTFGLTTLLGALYEQPVERVTVHGDGAKLASIREHLFHPDLFPVEPPFETRPIEQNLPLACGAVVRHFPLDHPGGSLGYRFDWPDRSLAYVTDTTAAGEASPYLEQIRGVDLLVHECNFRDGQEAWAAKTGHSSTTPVARLAAAAGVKRLVLMHFLASDESADPVGIETARQIFPATDLATDHLAIDF